MEIFKNMLEAEQHRGAVGPARLMLIDDPVASQIDSECNFLLQNHSGDKRSKLNMTLFSASKFYSFACIFLLSFLLM